MPKSVSPERREAQRYRIRIEVELQDGSGTTCDASATGVFFETAAPVVPGEPVEFVLRLERALPEGPLRLGCTGRIVRVERRQGRTGVGVALTSALASSGESEKDPGGRRDAVKNK